MILDIILPDAAIIVFIGLMGLCFGSFLNVVIYRLPNKISLLSPSSYCPDCNTKIKWYDNIPVFSYLILKGKCRNCSKMISIRYVFIEIFTAFIWIAIFWKFKVSYLMLLSLFVVLAFIAIAFIDIKHYIIPDSLNIFIALLGVISLFIAPIEGDVITINYIEKLISLFVSIAILLIISIVEKIMKKEIMGGGDIKLIAAVGLFLGWQLTILGIVIGSIIGVIIELLLRISKRKDGNILPFGPYLVLGFTIALFWGIELLEWYIGLLII